MPNGAGPTGEVKMLRLFESNLAAVDPKWRTLYVADFERGWRLQCDLDDVVHGLKSALKTERAAKNELRRELNRVLSIEGVSVLVRKQFDCPAAAKRDADTNAEQS